MFNAILVIGENAIWGKALKYTTRITFHWVLQFFAWILIGFGFGAIYANKNLHGKQHFASLHAIFGLVTLISIQVVILGGVWAKYSVKLRAILKPVRAKLIHSFFGIVAYNLGIVTIGLGLYTKWWDKVGTPEQRQNVLVLLVVTSLFVSYRPLKVCIKRLRAACARLN